MSILWLVIKIILLVLCGAVLLLLMTLLLVLCAPVRYEIYFEKYEQTAYEIRFSFLKGLRGHFNLNQGKRDEEVRLLWKVLHQVKTEDRKEKKHDMIQQSERPEKKKTSAAEGHQHSEKKRTQEKTVKKPPASERKTAASDSDTFSKSDFSLIQEMNYEFVKEVMVLICRIVKIIWPRSWDFELVIGSTDPGETGEKIAKLTMFYPLYYKHGIIRGNYERECMEGGFLAEGRFRLISIAVCFIKFCLKHSVRDMIKKVLNDGKEDENGKQSK